LAANTETIMGDVLKVEINVFGKVTTNFASGLQPVLWNRNYSVPTFEKVLVPVPVPTF
jgi:hypothetical protein